jgi:3-hydroxymyristoyl/3-hydroxydecanoyl-(acyl carrier protein) dehydratase
LPYTFMADRFAAFSFVDRITGYTPGVRARGQFAVPAALAAFPSCLVAEAVGQLAGWVAMAQADFRGRPVAALANETRFCGDVAPGAVLELEVEIDNCDAEAVCYAGRATSADALALELVDCLGPMLPVADFDSPTALAARFELLCGAGAPPGRFHGLPVPQIVRGAGVPGESLTAVLQVPAVASYFADHFPRCPVYPATLLLDAQIGLALQLAAQAPDLPAGTQPAAVRMTHVKMRAFIAPGAALSLDAQHAPTGDGTGRIMLSARANGKTVSTARLEYAPRRVAC